MAGEPLAITVAATDGERHSLRITITDEAGRLVDSRLPKPTPTGTSTVSIDPLPAGAYTVDVTGIRPGSPVAAVSSDVLIWSGAKVDVR